MNNIKCELCEQEKFKIKFKGNIRNLDFNNFAQYAYYDDILECTECGFIKQKKELSENEIEVLLKKEKYLEEPIGLLALNEKHFQFMQITKIINEYVNLEKVTLLDVGCNTGIFMNFINKNTRNIYGVEPSIEAALYARNQGLEVQNGIIANCTYPEGMFDVITMWDVVEHLSNPLDDLKKICSWLNSNGHGTIFISTHDINSLFARTLGKRYPMLMYQHFFHYSPISLSKLLEKSGFRVIGIHKIKKSWSIKYLHNLAIKLWPKSKFVKLITSFTEQIPDDSYIGKMQITFPMKDFFVLVAVKN